MPSFDDMKRIYSNTPTTVGQQLKQMSDMVMQDTWNNDLSTRLCYIYDYYHDDNKDKRTGYDPSQSKTKIPVNLKFIIKEYKSASKDDPEYHVQFEPNVWNTQSCVPDYFSKYSSLGIEYPLGLYVDIPDDRGVYWKWLIFYSEVANQFSKFGVMKCNYQFMWVTDRKTQRYKRAVWGVQRSQSSYNSGIYTYNLATVMENQSICWLPFNNITSEIYYNQRIIVSMPMERPITWKITKVENTKPKGVCSFALYQDVFDPDHDYVNINTGEMYADYYQSNVEPIVEESSDDKNTTLKNEITLSCSTNQIKVRGGYKSLTATVTDESNNDITNICDFKWEFEIDGNDVSDLIEKKETDDNNIIKIKFVGNEEYLGNVLTVKCIVNEEESILNMDIISL